MPQLDTLVSAAGTIDNGSVPADELQVLLQGVGEALVDNVQVIDSNGTNRIANGRRQFVDDSIFSRTLIYGAKSDQKEAPEGWVIVCDDNNSLMCTA